MIMGRKKTLDAIELFERAHALVSKVAPRAHDTVVLIVARELAMKGEIDLSTVRQIVIERDPVARRIASGLRGHAWDAPVAHPADIALAVARRQRSRP